jgi:hypothetical protein
MYLSEREFERESERLTNAIPLSVRSLGKGRRRRSEGDNTVFSIQFSVISIVDGKTVECLSF